MASEKAAAQRTTWRTGWRVGRLIALPLLLVLLTVLLTVLLAGWLTGSESGAQAAFRFLRSASGGMVAASEVHGRLLGPLQIGRLTLRQPDSDLEITQLQLAWQPNALRDGVLHIRLLRAASVQFAQHARLATPPSTFQSPLQLRLDKLDIGRVQITQDEQPLLALQGLNGSLHFDGQRIRQAALTINSIELAQLQRNWPDTRLRLQAQLDAEGKGKLLLQNLAPGRLDQMRVPLRRAEASFTLNNDALLLSALQLDAGPGAQLQGSASLRADALTLEFETQALDLRQLDARLRKTHLSGRASVSRSASHSGITQFRLALAEPWQHAPLKLTAEALLDASNLKVTAARLQHGAARAEFSGSLAFSGARQFAAHGHFQQLRLQDFAQFSNWPALTLNGQFDAAGKRGAPTEKAEATLEFAIRNSLLYGHALAGDGKLMLSPERLAIPHLQLSAGANQLRLHGELHGGLRANASLLQLLVQAPRLSQLGPQFGGSLQLSGSASGTPQAALINAEWQAQQLRLPGALRIADAAGNLRLQLMPQQPFPFRQVEASLTAHEVHSGITAIGALHMQLQTTMGMDDPLLLTVSAQKIVLNKRELEQAQLQVKGSLHSHVIALSFTRQGTTHQVGAQSSLTGLDRHSAWRGHIETLPLAALLALSEQSAVPSTDMELAGEWDLQLTGDAQTPLQASLGLRRRSGDVRLRGAQVAMPLANLGLQKLDVAARVNAGRLSVTLEAEGRQLGRLSFSGSSALAKGQLLQADPHAAIEGQLILQLPSINWLGALLSSGVLAEGSLRGEVSMTGSWSDPQLNGHLQGQQLRLLLVDSGIQFQRGVLDADFSGQSITLRQLQFAGSSGQVNVSGLVNVSAGKLDADLAIHAAQFGVYARSDRQLVISGDAKLAVQEGRARLDGNVIVDHGFFDIGRAATPHLSDDVIVTGSPQQAQRALLLDLDIGIGLGEHLVLRGRGLDARVNGALRFTSKAGAPPQTFGLMQVSKGSYEAYGRTLSIERGILRFDGAAGNPALDIRAMRRGTEVEPGVAIVGSALAPRIALVSEPTVPDAEKLAWLVLGHGLSNAAGNELGDLQGAAASLLSQGAAAGIQSQLASAFGLDTISLSSTKDNQDTVQQRIITLGKRVSSRLFVSYQQGLQTAAAVVLLRYTLSPRLTVEAESGTRSVFSLFYNINFD